MAATMHELDEFAAQLGFPHPISGLWASLNAVPASRFGERYFQVMKIEREMRDALAADTRAYHHAYDGAAAARDIGYDRCRVVEMLYDGCPYDPRGSIAQAVDDAYDRLPRRFALPDPQPTDED